MGWRVACVLLPIHVVIVVRYTARGPSGGGLWVQHELRSEDLVVIREVHRGGIVDETLAPERADGWAGVRYLLEGPGVACLPDRSVDLRAEDAIVCSKVGRAPVRSLTMTTDVLHIVWRRDSAIGASVPQDVKLAFSPLTRASLRRVVESLAAEDQGAGPFGAIREALLALRSEGLPVAPPPANGHHSASVNDYAVARALERVAFPLSTRPMSIDLSRALGVGEYHALRLANRYFRCFHLCVRSWRDYLKGQRVALGAFFMGRPGARTDEVARALGFQSPTSFCHAFLSAGLPSPQKVQRSLLSIGRGSTKRGSSPPEHHG